MDIDRTVEGLEIAIGHFEQQLFARFDPPAVSRQREKQVELGRGERQWLIL